MHICALAMESSTPFPFKLLKELSKVVHSILDKIRSGIDVWNFNCEAGLMTAILAKRNNVKEV